MEHIPCAEDFKSGADINAELDNIGFRHLMCPHILRQCGQQLHADKNIVAKPVFFGDNTVILIRNYICMSPECITELYFIDELISHIVIERRQSIHV